MWRAVYDAGDRLESAAEFHCGCGVRLKADTDALIQMRGDVMELPQSLHE
jgi:hypothetical protein